jgi:cell shape-determining protein MreD
MKFTVRDSRQSALLELDIRFRSDAFRDIFFSRRGIAVSLLRLALFLGVIYFSAVFQVALPRYFPELWFNFAGAAVAYLALRRSAFASMCAAFICGLILDAGSGVAAGPTSLLLTCAVASVGAVERLKTLPYPGTAAVIASAAVNLIHVGGMLLFFAGGMSWQQRGIAFLNGGVMGTLLTSLAWAPMLFAFMDLIAPAEAGTQEAADG